jgi:dynein heavy chain
VLQVRRYLHVVLCFSPVGDKFRIRARQFPALVNCTQLDWFHGWPHEALLSVAQRFLADVPDVTDDVRASMAQFMAQAHQVRHADSNTFWC